MPHVYDLAIIGGGINGCGLARDAAGRGLSVFLCEMGDLASGTSSRSTKLIHGGLRYLEHFDFRLVREALAEREVLWGIAPHIVRPMRFVLPYQQGLRPAWMLRVGLFMYDHLGGRQRLPGTSSLDLAEDTAGASLKPGVFTTAFEYSDCWVDDARLVVLNAIDAARRGAHIRVRTRALRAARSGDHWSLTVQEMGGAARAETIAARVLVNAAGPWVANVADLLASSTAHKVRLVQGSHIVVPRLFAHDRAYLFQSPDGRVVLAIPYEGEFTLIGTTDRDFIGNPAAATISGEETDYLCEAATACFAKPVHRSDIVWSYCGVRPLYDDGAGAAQAASREYVLEVDEAPGAPPLLAIIGGKITTYRRLAEAVLERLAPYLPERHGLAAGWTGAQPLPGGDFNVDGFDDLAAALARDYPFLQSGHVRRLAHAYGTDARGMLGGAQSAADLGRSFGATLTEAEVRYLIAQEWARSADDVVWRRSKLGLRLTPAEIAGLDEWMRDAAATGLGSST
jgi:glycerol-3-phosphate dehydrogenase